MWEAYLNGEVKAEDFLAAGEGLDQSLLVNLIKENQ